MTSLIDTSTLIIGNYYALVWFDFVFIGRLEGFEKRHAYKLEQKIEKGKLKTINSEPVMERIDLGPQYDVLIFSSDIPFKSDREIMIQMFNNTQSKKQFYFTNPIIFQSNVINTPDWIIKKLTDIRMNIVSEQNLNINLKILESMLLKDWTSTKDQKREVKLIIEMIKMKGTEIILEKMTNWESHCEFETSQLPFE